MLTSIGQDFFIRLITTPYSIISMEWSNVHKKNSPYSGLKNGNFIKKKTTICNKKQLFVSLLLSRRLAPVWYKYSCICVLTYVACEETNCLMVGIHTAKKSTLVKKYQLQENRSFSKILHGLFKLSCLLHLSQYWNYSAFIFTSVAVDFFQVRFPAREYPRHKAEKTHVDWHVINQSVMDL